MRIVFIGAGNLATHLAEACKASGNEIAQIYSRTMESATLLAGKTGATPINELAKISPVADLYLFAVRDDVLPAVIQQMPHTGGVWAHTAGSLPMQLFATRKTEYGVIYPLQTFSKNRKIDFTSIPVFIEGSSPATTLLLEELACSLSRNVRCLSGEKRRYLHLSAVFACNFVNHMYTLASEIIGKEDIPFEVLIPLITETAAKVTEMTPQEAQTGPAVRSDEAVMRSHVSMLTNQLMKDIYILISKSIYHHSL